MAYAPPAPPIQPPARPRSRKWWAAAWVLPTATVLALIAGTGIGNSTAKPKTVTQQVPGPTQTMYAPTETATATVHVTTRPTVVKTVATVHVTKVVIYHPPVKVAFADGTFRVGSEIQPGTYHTDPAGSACYWERDSSSSGLDGIIANDNITGPTTIDISSGDYAFKSSGGCSWARL